jgi:uncharacterized OsmC-like protein
MKNVNLQAVSKFLEDTKKDESLLKRKMQVKVVWNFDESLPQMFSELEFPKGKVKIECDGAPFAGGGGRAPNPIQFCLFGMASCFLGTFAAVAAEHNLKVDSIEVVAENEVNLRRPLGLSDDPVVEKIKMTVHIKSDEPQEKINLVKEIAIKRCPAVYCITNPIPLEIDVSRKK